jgi:hypothetical protein
MRPYPPRVFHKLKNNKIAQWTQGRMMFGSMGL